MQGIYTKQVSLTYYRVILFTLVAFSLFLFRVITVGGNHQGNTSETSYKNIPAAAKAPQICHISADTTITQCGSSVTLHTDADIPNYTWSNGSTSPGITVTESGQYYWQFIDMSRNTVTNGDFTSGNTGFTSAYNYIAPTGSTGAFGSLSAEGYYTVTTSPRITHTNFANFPDHTTGTGKMMVLNGSPTANAKVWGQSISVEPNTSYIFSIWAASAHASNPAKLTFSINGSQLGVIQLTTTTGAWQNFTVQWTSGSSDTTAAIGIVNQNTIASGNDFALDDIVFAPVCRKIYNVTLTPNPDKPAITNN
jgi:hypothetical protein